MGILEWQAKVDFAKLNKLHKVEFNGEELSAFEFTPGFFMALDKKEGPEEKKTVFIAARNQIRSAIEESDK